MLGKATKEKHNDKKRNKKKTAQVLLYVYTVKHTSTAMQAEDLGLNQSYI